MWKNALCLLVTFICFLRDSTLSKKLCPPRPDEDLIFRATFAHDRFYVDVEHGNDNWNGRISFPADGEGPFKTLSGAIDGIRKSRTSVRKRATLFVRSGNYFVSKPIVLDARDKYLSLVGYPGDERPLLSGAHKISGKNFEPFNQNVFVASINGKCSNHIFLGRKRLVRARKPNLRRWTGQDMTGQGPYLKIKHMFHNSFGCNRKGSGGFRQEECHWGNKNGFEFKKGDIDHKWSNPETGNILVFHAWTAERGNIKSVVGNHVNFTSSLRSPIGNHPKPSGWRYIIEHIFEELDATGEYFCDEKRKLLFIIPPSEALKHEDVFISSTRTLFVVQNTKGIEFVDLEFRHSNDRAKVKYNPRPALLEFNKADVASIYHCAFSNVGHTAIFLYNSSTNVKIAGNSFYNIGYIAISTSSGTRNLLIRRNTFEGCGVWNMFQPSCIHVRGMKKIIVKENRISYTPYAGMRIGSQQTFKQDYVREGEYVFYIEKNDVRNYGLGILNDFGGIYLSPNVACSGPEATSTFCHLHARVAFNTIHHSSAYYYGAHGIYGDLAVSSLTVEKNWLYNLDGAAVVFLCGKRNFALNNMIYHIDKSRVLGTCSVIAGRGVLLKQDLTFKKNVIFVSNVYARMWRPLDEWIYDVPQVDGNVYYFSHENSSQVVDFFPKYKSWNEWKRSTFNDLRSVIDNPQYWNLAGKDYRLKRTSVARQIGIQSVDLRKVRSRSGIC
ncbi:unnamed protein product [Clavelina lepadiformis]|uniref:Right handed beta helix domain-containing protein n=1 Tax=Clavelina lepadiformis TaxID=159417 RepID=A0ABP0F5K4_CLALP